MSRYIYLILRLMTNAVLNKYLVSRIECLTRDVFNLIYDYAAQERYCLECKKNNLF